MKRSMKQNKIIGKCKYCHDPLYGFQKIIRGMHRGCSEIEATEKDADREMIGDDVDYGLREEGR